MELQKNDLVELNIEALGVNGEGVARYEGKTIFIKGALKGERVRAKIIAVKPRFNFALLEKVLLPSLDRVEPNCPNFGKCGGCDLMHLKQTAQAEFKRELVKDTLLHIGGIDAEVLPVVTGEKSLRYRNKLSFPVRKGRNGETTIGLFAKGSHRVVETRDCLLQYEWNSRLVEAVRAFMEAEKLTAYDDESGNGIVRHIVAREIAGNTLVTLVCTKKIDLKGLYRELKSALLKVELYLNINRRRDNIILGDEWLKVGGESNNAVVDGFSVAVHPASFFQVNDEIREKLYKAVAEKVSGSSVIEAFSGAGLLSAIMSKRADEVYGIEINESAHESAFKMKENNGLENFYPVLGDVTEKLGGVIARCKKKPFIVLDPPRSGIDGKVVEAIASADISGIVYVSCNPATLARDLKAFSEKGYAVASVQPYDMFPQTSNVETLAVLQKQNL